MASPTPCPLNFHYPDSLSPTHLFLFTSRLRLIPGDLLNLSRASPGMGNRPLTFSLASPSPRCRGAQAGHNRREVSSFPLGNSFQDLRRGWQGDAAVDDGKSCFPCRNQGVVRGWAGGPASALNPAQSLQWAPGLLSLQLSLLLSAASSPRLGSECPISVLFQELPAPLSWLTVTQALPGSPASVLVLGPHPGSTTARPGSLASVTLPPGG